MKVITVLAVALFSVFLFACSQQGTEPAESAAGEMPSKSESAEKLFAAYERVRSQLANDEAVSRESFESIAEAARSESVAFSGEAKRHLEQLASSAESGADKASEGLESARESFGEISRRLIALLSAKPDLVKGRYVFECPMTKSYPKWVQRSESVSNPYMGPEMATCGAATEWQP